MLAFLISQVFNVLLDTHNWPWCTRVPLHSFHPFYFTYIFLRKTLVLIGTVFLLSRINIIINIKPFNYDLGGAGEGLLAVCSLLNLARDFLFTLGRIGRLIASLIILLSRLEVLGRES